MGFHVGGLFQPHTKGSKEEDKGTKEGAGYTWGQREHQGQGSEDTGAVHRQG